ncbi:MAG: hypothetical protein IT210_14340 [Armatimonadetes bacterium]|nr:hypothetical protein [Armatimonadota bacterium]
MREPHAPREPGICQLNRVPIRECGEELVDLRTFCPDVVLITKLPWLRRTVAGMLNEAQCNLSTGYRLKIGTALRTLEIQAGGYWNYFNGLKEKHPEWPYSIMRRQANKFFHPPDTPTPPGHCTGGAVDIGILDPEGNDLDLSSASREGKNTQPTYALFLAPQAKENRRMLIEAMSRAGFSNCYDEWWHWSYGDSGWACRLGKPFAIYGMLTEERYPPPVFEDIARLKAEKEAQQKAKDEEALQGEEAPPEGTDGG